MSRVVFVGNIAYEATEEDLRGFFSQVGPVSSFRLVLDHESKKPRGFGFCDFLDAHTAQSAIRNRPQSFPHCGFSLYPPPLTLVSSLPCLQ